METNTWPGIAELKTWSRNAKTFRSSATLTSFWSWGTEKMIGSGRCTRVTSSHSTISTICSPRTNNTTLSSTRGSMPVTSSRMTLSVTMSSRLPKPATHYLWRAPQLWTVYSSTRYLKLKSIMTKKETRKAFPYRSHLFRTRSRSNYPKLVKKDQEKLQRMLLFSPLLHQTKNSKDFVLFQEICLDQIFRSKTISLFSRIIFSKRYRGLSNLIALISIRSRISKWESPMPLVNGWQLTARIVQMLILRAHKSNLC